MQNRHRPQLLAALLACTVAVTAACNSKKDEATPSAQIQSNSPAQAANSPESVTGCLRAGDAPDTFVLTTTMSNDGRQPATYQLSGSGGVNLTEHIGERVMVQGVVRTQQESTTATRETPANAKPQGTMGSPTVSTSATLDLKRMDVTSVSRAEGKCDTKQ
jgi:hypothetical protein